jgi:phage gpG-like protein
MLRVEIERREKLTRDIAGIDKLVSSKKIMGKIANFIQFSIKQRTAKGYDVNDEDFTPYAESTVKQRQRAGRGTYLVDLNVTGSMLASMTHTSYDNYAEIFFMPSYSKKGSYNPEIAFYHSEYNPEGKMPHRDFFDVSTYEMQKIMDLYEKYLEESL